MSWTIKSRAALLAVTVCGSVSLNACFTGSDEPLNEPLVARMVITIGELEYTATRETGGFGGQVAVVPLGSFNFVASFFTADGSRETVVTSDDFEVRVARDAAGSALPLPLTFERTGAFTGTITGLADGQEVSIYFRLHHKSLGHSDFGPYFLIVRRTENPGGGGGGGGGNLP